MFQFTLWSLPGSFILLFFFGSPLSRSGFGLAIYAPPPPVVIVQPASLPVVPPLAPQIPAPIELIGPFAP